MSKPSKTIMLSYLQLSNVGCEIIVRGTVAFLLRAYPQYDLRFVFPTYHEERDRKLLADLPIDLVPMLGWKRYLRAILRMTGRFDRYWSPRFSAAAFAKANLFVSIGGDIYTIFNDQLPDDWMGYETFATARGIPSIMFGANMERFEILPDAKRKLLVEHLNRFKLLAVRDRSTEAYLGTHSVTAPVVVFPDPVYTLRPAATMRPGKPRRIGFNFSPLTLEKFGNHLVGKYADIVAELIREGYDFDFIPHVYSSDGDASLDDRGSLNAVYQAIPSELRSKITLHDNALGFEAISKVIAQTDLVVGARMHCCLNAVTLGKPVLFLEYSKKAKAMVDWLQSDSPYSRVAAAYDSVPADTASVENVRALIAAFEALPALAEGPVTIDLGESLGASKVWPILKQLDL